VEQLVKLAKPINQHTMTTCLNCGITLGCGCQKRTASNGKSACSTCLGKYEQSLKALKQAAPTTPSTGTAPTNVNVFYKAP